MDYSATYNIIVMSYDPLICTALPQAKIEALLLCSHCDMTVRRSGGNYEKASVLKGHDMIVKTLANDGADTVVSGGWDGRVIAWKVRVAS